MPNRHPSDHRSSERDPHLRDHGAALVIAIGFMVMIGAIAAGLTSMVTSGVGNRVQLEAIRNRQYAADGLVEHGIADLRGLITAGSVHCGDAWWSTDEMNGVTIRLDVEADCVVVAGADRLPVRQFVARFAACADTGAPCATDQVVVRALVGFETGATGAVVRTSVRSWSVER